MNTKRLQKELYQMKNNAPEGCYLISKNPSNLNKWTCAIKGPDDTPYENGYFQMEINFPPNYPFKPPRVAFITEIFHPNVSNEDICLDILACQWNPTFTVPKLLMALRSLLDEPNFDDPLYSEATELHNKSKEEFNKKVRELVQEKAIKNF